VEALERLQGPADRRKVEKRSHFIWIGQRKMNSLPSHYAS
jgi:hypothetical protein